MEIIDIGEEVHCDFCNEGEDSMGGVIVGSNAVCGKCTKKYEYDKPDYKYADEIGVIFDKKKTFKENVLQYRELMYGSRNGTIEIMPFSDFEEINT